MRIRSTYLFYLGCLAPPTLTILQLMDLGPRKTLSGRFAANPNQSTRPPRRVAQHILYLQNHELSDTLEHNLCEGVWRLTIVWTIVLFDYCSDSAQDRAKRACRSVSQSFGSVEPRPIHPEFLCYDVLSRFSVFLQTTRTFSFASLLLITSSLSMDSS